ncbi:MAG: S41 family peptidase, partial [Gemmatimonadota bacterium]|nr:S41 family peptidase [Gemmatimonadota bacterium]
TQAGNVYQQARLFDDVLGYVADFYVDSVSEAELYDMAIDGLLDKLDDPYARFLRAEDIRELTESTTGNYGGLGIRIDVRDGWITIIAPMAESPAEAAGLETGDRIVEVDGESTYGWKSDRAVSVLRGEPGSKVTISVVRAGFPEPFEVTVERAEIHIRAIQAATILGSDVGYVSLVNSSVSETLTDELADAVTDLRARGARSLLLDLRYNPGGLLDQGVEVADLFLDPGQDVVTTRGRGRGANESYSARRDQQWPDMPIVVLVNGGTASAAEIIAGALQDHDRAVVLGEATFGKGVVQTVFRLGRTQALRLTTARWFTPSGRTIQRPHGGGDVLLMAAAADSARAVPDSGEEFRTEAGRVVRGGGGIQPDLVVFPDTLTEPEQAFARSLGARLPAYRDVLTSYAIDLKGANTITDSAFVVSSAMRRELERRLSERAIDVPAVAWDLVNQQFIYEVQRYVFGRRSENARRLSDDRQVQQALELLRGSRTVDELFAAVQRISGEGRGIE